MGETLNIKLKGESNIIIKDEDGNYKGVGIYMSGPVNIMDDPDSDGIGQLNINALNKAIHIWYQGNLTITGGKLNCSIYGTDNCAGVCVSHGDIIISGGSLIAKDENEDVQRSCHGIAVFDGKLFIYENAEEVTAVGPTEAISGEIHNVLYGKAWTNLEGTGDPDIIPPLSAGSGLPSGKYKKVSFQPEEPTPTPEPTPIPAKISGTPLTTMKAGDTSMTIAWQKVTGAEGYDIFFSRCDGKGKTTAKKAQTINGNSTFAWTRSGLTAGVSYKAYVKAYVMKNGSKQYVAASPLMHAYTKGYTKRYTNAKSVKVKKTKVSIKKGKTFKIKAKVKKLKKGKKLMPTKHELKLRYLSTDSSIATVSKKGKIKGVKAGTCYVYAYAHNGVFKKIKVTVK